MKKKTKAKKNQNNRKNQIEKKTKSGEIIKSKKVRTILIASIAAVLCVAIGLVAILYRPMHPIEKFAYKLMKKQNFQMDVVISGIPLFGSIAFAVETDGNITHIPDLYLTEECYIEKVGSETFRYTQDEKGNWVKSKDEDDSALDFLSEDDLKDLINPDNYDLVEGTENVYRQKADVQFEKFKNITITLEKKSCKIEMIASMEGMALETQIVISKIGEVNLKLPKVG